MYSCWSHTIPVGPPLVIDRTTCLHIVGLLSCCVKTSLPIFCCLLSLHWCVVINYWCFQKKEFSTLIFILSSIIMLIFSLLFVIFAYLTWFINWIFLWWTMMMMILYVCDYSVIITCWLLLFSFLSLAFWWCCVEFFTATMRGESRIA